MEQKKLQKQLKCTEDEFYSQRNNLASVHAEEKKTLVEVHWKWTGKLFRIVYHDVLFPK